MRSRERRKYISRLLLLCVVAIVGWSCKTTQRSVRTSTAAEKSFASAGSADREVSRAIHDSVMNNHIQFNTFSARAKFGFESAKEKQQGITTYVRMQRDSVIWISVRPVLGIELARILITPDSVKLVNYFKKTVTLRSTDSLQELLHIPFDFNALQNVLVGNPVYLTDTLYDVRKTAAMISFLCKGEQFTNRFEVAGNYLLRHNYLAENDNAGNLSRSCDMKYSDYERVSGRSFAMRRHIAASSAKDSVLVDIQYNKVDFDKPLSFPFSFGEKYRNE